MFMIRLIRFILGTVTFKGTGGFAARFVNLCHLNQIPLWEMTTEDGVLRAKTSLRGYKKMRIPARKSAVKLRATEKSGLPFLLHSNRARIGLVIGLAAAVLLYALAASCIWRVEVSGNEKISERALLQIAADAGLERGTRKGRLDVSVIENAIKSNLPSISWTAVNIRGSTAVIEVREQVEAPDIVADEGAYDIVASRDGYIEELTISRGVAVAKNHMTVSKGDVLISGVVQRKDATYYTVRAMGVCYARTQRAIEASADCAAYMRVSVTGENRYIYFFGLRLLSSLPKQGSNIVTGEEDMIWQGDLLPVGVETQTVYEKSSLSEEQLTEKERRLLACADFYEQYLPLCETCEMTEQNLSFSDTQPLTIRWSGSCRENIALEQPITTIPVPETEP